MKKIRKNMLRVESNSSSLTFFAIHLYVWIRHTSSLNFEDDFKEIHSLKYVILQIQLVCEPLKAFHGLLTLRTPLTVTQSTSNKLARLKMQRSHPSTIQVAAKNNADLSWGWFIESFSCVKPLTTLLMILLRDILMGVATYRQRFQRRFPRRFIAIFYDKLLSKYLVQ